MDMPDGQARKYAAPEVTQQGNAPAAPELKKVELGGVVEKANKEIEKAKKEVEAKEKYNRIVALINRNMTQMAKGQKPEGTCTC